jgi:hypothetical protein
MVMHWDDVTLVRPLIVALVKTLNIRGHSTMEAYAMIAAGVGKSDKWVRNIIGRNQNTKISFSDIISIKRICYKLNVSTEQLDAEADAIIRGKKRAAGLLSTLPSDPFKSESAVQIDLFPADQGELTL